MTEKSQLLNSGDTLPQKMNSSKSFIFATSMSHEIKLLTQRCSLMAIQLLCWCLNTPIATIFIGQLPDSTLYLSGTGISRTFVNVTGTAMSWGFTTSLFTLLPQAIGHGRTKLASIYIQRAFYIVTIISCLLSTIQFFAGDLMMAIGQPPELKPIIDRYCRLLIPYIFLVSYAMILMRLVQALDLNTYLTYCSFTMLICSPFFAWFFMFALEMGYKGAALSQCCTIIVFCVAQLLLLVYKGYGYIFKPHSLSVVLTQKGMKEYINLAIPGLFQTAFQWIMEEMAVILSGYVVQPTIALSTTVILINIYFVVLAFPVGIQHATNLRVGKYIGSGNIGDAKRSAKVGVALAMILMFIWCIIFIFGRDVIPRIYTDNVETIKLTSKMMLIVMIYAMGCFVLLSFGGIYRGLGFQKIPAIFVFVSFWIIAWPISVILLFRVGFVRDLEVGVATIWSGLALGNVLAGIGVVFYLLCCIDWESAVSDAKSRIKETMRDYQSTKINIEKTVN